MNVLNLATEEKQNQILNNFPIEADLLAIDGKKYRPKMKGVCEIVNSVAVTLGSSFQYNNHTIDGEYLYVRGEHNIMKFDLSTLDWIATGAHTEYGTRVAYQHCLVGDYFYMPVTFQGCFKVNKHTLVKEHTITTYSYPRAVVSDGNFLYIAESIDTTSIRIRSYDMNNNYAYIATTPSYPVTSDYSSLEIYGDNLYFTNHGTDGTTRNILRFNKNNLGAGIQGQLTLNYSGTTHMIKAGTELYVGRGKSLTVADLPLLSNVKTKSLSHDIRTVIVQPDGIYVFCLSATTGKMAHVYLLDKVTLAVLDNFPIETDTCLNAVTLIGGKVIAHDSGKLLDIKLANKIGWYEEA